MIYAIHKRTKEHRISQPGTMWDGDSWHLVPADDDGWIEHDGKECPLPVGASHEVKFRSGMVSKTGCPDVWRWGHRSDRADIIAYRPVLAWDGEGLPPVGARCEMLIAGWEEVFIAGMDSRGRAIAEVISSGILIPSKDAGRFRPIRNAIEISEDAMIEASGYASSPSIARIVRNIYDAIRDGKVPGVKLEGH